MRARDKDSYRTVHTLRERERKIDYIDIDRERERGGRKERERMCVYVCVSERNIDS